MFLMFKLERGVVWVRRWNYLPRVGWVALYICTSGGDSSCCYSLSFYHSAVTNCSLPSVNVETTHGDRADENE